MDMLRDAAFATWHQIGTQYSTCIPEYVLKSEPPTEKAAKALDYRLFADRVDRAFMVDSPEAVWTSAAYFAKNADTYYADRPGTKAAVEADIKRAAAVFGISEDVDNIMAVVRDDSIEKKASDADDPTNWGWPERRKYPLFVAGDIEKASSYFMQNKHLYTAEDRYKVASKVISKATEFGVEPPEEMLKYARIGIPRVDTLAAEILIRMKEAEYRDTSPALIQALGECITKVAVDTSALDTETLSGIVDILDAVDRLHDPGGSRAKNAEFLDPETAAFGITPGEARRFTEDSVPINGYVFSVEKLASLGTTVYEQVLGDDFVRSMTKADGTVNTVKFATALTNLSKQDGKALCNALLTF